jgi:uncharacterized protein (DUF1778 family)
MTKALIARAAQFERRKLMDFCVTALTKAARQMIAEHETFLLSERESTVLFKTLVSRSGAKSTAPAILCQISAPG